MKINGDALDQCFLSSESKINYVLIRYAQTNVNYFPLKNIDK